jgi:DNA-binding GntR family transcriptional regulator
MATIDCAQKEYVMNNQSRLSDQLLVDRNSPVPLYHQIAEQLEAMISSGQLLPGAKLENVISFAGILGMSRPTIRQAIDVLVRKQLLVRRRGVGTQVAHRGLDRRIELTSLYDDLGKTGLTPTTHVIELGPSAATSDMARFFEIEEGDKLIHVRRLRLANGKPLAIMNNWLPMWFDGVTAEDLTYKSLYDLMREIGHCPKSARQGFMATQATTAQATLLDTVLGASLLSMSRRAYDDAGRPIEYACHYYLGVSYTVEVTFEDEHS